MPFARAVATRTHRRVVFVTSAQMGKSDALLDIIGQRLDQAPAPILYVGPNKQFLTEQFEPASWRCSTRRPTLRARWRAASG
jgi:phage terminase large subunit GpA-like protein